MYLTKSCKLLWCYPGISLMNEFFNNIIEFTYNRKRKKKPPAKFTLPFNCNSLHILTVLKIENDPQKWKNLGDNLVSFGQWTLSKQIIWQPALKRRQDQMPGLLKNWFSSYSPFCTKTWVPSKSTRLSRKFENKAKQKETCFFSFVNQLFYIGYLSLLNITLLQLYLVLILYKVNKETI